MFVYLLSARNQGLAPDKEVVEKHTADLSGKLDVYDKILSKQKYLVGDVRLFFLRPHTPTSLETPLLSYRKLRLWTFIICLQDLPVRKWVLTFWSRNQMSLGKIFYSVGEGFKLTSSSPIKYRWFKDISSRDCWQAVQEEIQSTNY
jgi:glutathione S-transferase